MRCACAVEISAAGQRALLCWGLDRFGALGHGSTMSSRVPVQVVGVRCWGENFEGQLGNGSTEVQSRVPVKVHL